MPRFDPSSRNHPSCCGVEGFVGDVDVAVGVRQKQRQ
jgi:hypothetical protein